MQNDFQSFVYMINIDDALKYVFCTVNNLTSITSPLKLITYYLIILIFPYPLCLKIFSMQYNILYAIDYHFRLFNAYFLLFVIYLQIY